MSILEWKFNPEASSELRKLAESPVPEERRAAAQIYWLLELMRSNAGIRDRLRGTHETVSVMLPGESIPTSLDIKIIWQLRDIANDSSFHTDAIRRIRMLNSEPVDKYRVFYAMFKNTGVILGVFPRNHAYSEDTISALKTRYERS